MIQQGISTAQEKLCEHLTECLLAQFSVVLFIPISDNHKEHLSLKLAYMTKSGAKVKFTNDAGAIFHTRTYNKTYLATSPDTTVHDNSVATANRSNGAWCFTPYGFDWKATPPSERNSPS